MIDGFFTDEDGILIPQASAVSGWDMGTIRGPALTAAMARVAERALPAPGMKPAHAAFDLFRPARMAPTTTRSSVLRVGRRLCTIDVVLDQNGVDVAHGRVTFLRPSEDPSGLLWRPSTPVAAPAPSIRPDAEGRLYLSDADWTPAPSDHANDLRKSVWQRTHMLIRGEQPSAFQRAASASDLTSLTAHWGTEGIEFINADVTLSLARLPSGPGIGVSATYFVSNDGLSAASAVLFDEDGAFATSTLSGLANPDRRVRVGKPEQGATAAHDRPVDDRFKP
jgi:hypothetical protein